MRVPFVWLIVLVLGLVACVDRPPAASEAPDAARLDAGPRPAAPDAATPPPLDGGPPIPHRTPPFSGGNVLGLRDGERAAVADPDSDRLFVATLFPTRSVVAYPLPAGSEPGRMVEDGAHRIHVALRAGRAIATLAPGDSVPVIRPACAAPRGIAWRALDDTLVLACADGSLQVFPAAGGDATRTLALDDDLRDVVLAGDHVLVSRFRSAEVLELDATLALVARHRPPAVVHPDVLAPDGTAEVTFEPAVAWRMLPDGAGGAVVLHQRARGASVPFSGTTTTSPMDQPSYGVSGPECAFPMVESAISTLHIGSTPTFESGAPLPGMLVMDIAVDPAPPSLAPGDSAPRPLQVVPASMSCDLRDAHLLAQDEVRAVGYSSRHGVLALTVGPLRLTWTDRDGAPGEIVLDAFVPDDVGRELFHRVAPSGLACASCHPEGGDDGRVWQIGERPGVRTPAARGHVLATLPFDWEGDMASFGAFVESVWVARMHGAALSGSSVEQLASWVDGLDAPPPPELDAAAIARGRALFESTEVGCATCHAGEHLTNGLTVDVGTGGAFQVPQLIGVAYRAPYLHDGCAPTLRERITGDASCTGGDAHGHVSDLGPEQVDDLVAYLRSI